MHTEEPSSGNNFALIVYKYHYIVRNWHIFDSDLENKKKRNKKNAVYLLTLNRFILKLLSVKVPKIFYN